VVTGAPKARHDHRRHYRGKKNDALSSGIDDMQHPARDSPEVAQGKLRVVEAFGDALTYAKLSLRFFSPSWVQEITGGGILQERRDELARSSDGGERVDI
jgi:hypothetical protein